MFSPGRLVYFLPQEPSLTGQPRRIVSAACPQLSWPLVLSEGQNTLFQPFEKGSLRKLSWAALVFLKTSVLCVGGRWTCQPVGKTRIC